MKSVTTILRKNKIRVKRWGKQRRSQISTYTSYRRTVLGDTLRSSGWCRDSKLNLPAFGVGQPLSCDLRRLVVLSVQHKGRTPCVHLSTGPLVAAKSFPDHCKRRLSLTATVSRPTRTSLPLKQESRQFLWLSLFSNVSEHHTDTRPVKTSPH